MPARGNAAKRIMALPRPVPGYGYSADYVRGWLCAQAEAWHAAETAAAEALADERRRIASCIAQRPVTFEPTDGAGKTGAVGERIT